MKTYVSLVGEHRDREVVWPDDWPIPPVGANVSLDDNTSVWVRAVDWHPQGTLAGYNSDTYEEPYVYIVLGERRPE